MNQEDIQKQLELQKQIQVLETAVKQHLSKEAISRYGNVKAAHPEKALQIITIMAQLIQSGQITEKITDEQFKEILRRLDKPKQETRIRKI